MHQPFKCTSLFLFNTSQFASLRSRSLHNTTPKQVIPRRIQPNKLPRRLSPSQKAPTAQSYSTNNLCTMSPHKATFYTANSSSSSQPTYPLFTDSTPAATNANDSSFHSPTSFTGNIAEFYVTIPEQPRDTWYCPNPYGGCEGMLNMEWQTHCPICGAARPQ